MHRFRALVPPLRTQVPTLLPQATITYQQNVMILNIVIKFGFTTYRYTSAFLYPNFSAKGTESRGTGNMLWLLVLRVYSWKYRKVCLFVLSVCIYLVLIVFANQNSWTASSVFLSVVKWPQHKSEWRTGSMCQRPECQNKRTGQEWGMPTGVMVTDMDRAARATVHWLPRVIAPGHGPCSGPRASHHATPTHDQLRGFKKNRFLPSKMDKQKNGRKNLCWLLISFYDSSCQQRVPWATGSELVLVF